MHPSISILVSKLSRKGVELIIIFHYFKVKKNILSENISQLRADVFSVVEQIEQRKILYEQLQNRAQSIQGEDRYISMQLLCELIR